MTGDNEVHSRYTNPSVICDSIQYDFPPFVGVDERGGDLRLARRHGSAAATLRQAGDRVTSPLPVVVTGLRASDPDPPGRVVMPRGTSRMTSAAAPRRLRHVTCVERRPGRMGTRRGRPPLPPQTHFIQGPMWLSFRQEVVRSP
jgi:hypothetical protein